jgi:hypothetical protein
MAHAKTTVGQVLSQVGIGAIVLGVSYFSLRDSRKPSEDSLPQSNTVELLDREIQTNTTGKVWGLEQQHTSSTREQEQQESTDKHE